MPRTMTTTKSSSIDSNSFVQRFTDTGENRIESAPTIPAAKAGVLTVRTDLDTGSLTMDTGHGITTGQKLDVFWTVAGVSGQRRNMTVGTVATNVVPIDGGSGDDLPAAASAIQAMVPVEYSLTFTGTTAVALGASSPVNGFVVFCVNTSTLTAPVKVGPNQDYSWGASMGVANPVTGVTITLVKFSHGDASQARDMLAIAILDV